MKQGISFLILLFLILGCKEMSAEDKGEITEFLQNFYVNIDSFTKDEISSLFQNQECRFMFDDHSNYSGLFIDDFENLMSFLEEWQNKVGKQLDYSIVEISYPDTVYDIPASNLYFARIRVTYEKSSSVESFLFQKKEGVFKIYRYRIEFK